MSDLWTIYVCAVGHIQDWKPFSGTCGCGERWERVQVVPRADLRRAERELEELIVLARGLAKTVLQKPTVAQAEHAEWVAREKGWLTDAGWTWDESTTDYHEADSS